MAIMTKFSKKETARKAFIEKKSKAQKKNILLSIRASAVDAIDDLVRDKMGVTRTQWILQAIQKSLEEQGV